MIMKILPDETHTSVDTTVPGYSMQISCWYRHHRPTMEPLSFVLFIVSVLLSFLLGVSEAFTTTTTTTTSQQQRRQRVVAPPPSPPTVSSSVSSVLPSTSSSSLFASVNDGSTATENDDEEQQRMKLVRQLQKTFYASPDTVTANAADPSPDQEDEGAAVSSSSTATPSPPPTTTHWERATGRILNLPLWRVGWTEVPGRSNCLNVHEGHYTNMFEKILRSSPEHNTNHTNTNAETGYGYFGHLYLPGGTKAARSKEEKNNKRLELKSWQDEIEDRERFDAGSTERSAVLGCVMRITDYRRFEDGRLLLLVQALDRFVVDTVIDAFPHGLAHVQIVPDLEDTDPYLSSSTSTDENFGRLARGKAVQQASDYYYNYECDPTISLAVSSHEKTDYLSSQDVYGPDIAKVLPFCVYAPRNAPSSTALDDPEAKEKETNTKRSSSSSENDTHDEDSDHTTTDQDDTLATGFQGGQPLLEDILRSELILRDPAPLAGVGTGLARRQQHDLDCTGIEKLVWLGAFDPKNSTPATLLDSHLCSFQFSLLQILHIICFANFFSNWLLLFIHCVQIKAVEDLCRNYKFSLPHELAILIPPDMQDYLEIPTKQNTNDYNRGTTTTTSTHNSTTLCSTYPIRRRQTRLSYSIPALMENTNIGASIPTRQILLSAPSTRIRLLAVLERLELLNTAVLGQFE